MNSQNNIENVEFDKILPYAAAANTDLTSSTVDGANYDNFEFLLGFGAAAAGGTIVINGSHNDSSWTALHTETYTTAVANKLVAIQLLVPNYRYLQVVVTRAGNNALDNCVVRKRHPRITPAPANDAVIRRIVAYSPNTLPNAAAVTRLVS